MRGREFVLGMVCEYGDCQKLAVDEGIRGAQLCQEHSEEFAQMVREGGSEWAEQAMRFFVNLKPVRCDWGLDHDTDRDFGDIPG